MVDTWLTTYKNLDFTFKLRTYIFSLPKKYTYSKFIASKRFNHNKVVEELDNDVGIKDMKCECSSSNYCYSPVRHIVTGDLKLIKDIKLRNMIVKRPNYGEQNNINWNVNSKIYKEAVCLNTK